MKCYSLLEGSSPLLISMPHIGLHIPKNIEVLKGKEAFKRKDTNWYIDKLYGVANDLGATSLSLTKVVRLSFNRGIDGVNLYPCANSTEPCPSSSFNNIPIYSDCEKVTPEDVDKRVAQYWLPYHEKIKQTLAKIKEEFGFAIILDARSILSEVLLI